MEPENNGFQMDFPLQGPIFRFHVKFRGCTFPPKKAKNMGPNKCLKTVHFSSCHENWSGPTILDTVTPYLENGIVKISANFWVKKKTFHFKFSIFSMEEVDASRGDGQNTLEEYLCLFSCSKKISCMFGDILVILEPFLLNPT